MFYHHLRPDSPTTLPPISLFRFLSHSYPLREASDTFPMPFPLISLLRLPSHVTVSFSALFLPKTSTLPPTRQMKLPLHLTLYQRLLLLLPHANLLSVFYLHYYFHPSNKYFTTLLVILKYCFFISAILRFEPLINSPNRGTLVGQDLSINSLIYLEYIFYPVPNDSAPYKLAQSMSPFLMESH